MVRKAVLVVWMLSLLLLRPSAFSELYNRELLYLFWLLSFVVWLFHPVAQKIKVEQRQLKLFYLIGLLLVYLGVQGVLLSNAIPTVVNATVYVVGSVIAIFLVLRNYNQTFILKTFISIHVILGVSAIISTGLIIFNGLDWQPLIMVKLPEQIYKGGHFILFPLSEYWSNVRLGAVNFPRFVGIYREPGAAQTFFVTSFFLTYYLKMPHKNVVRIVLFIGSILTFSTATILNLIAGFIVLGITNEKIKRIFEGRLNKRIVVFVVLAIILTSFILMVDSQLNIFIKTSTQTESGLSRISALQESTEDFLKRPIFGYGYYYGFTRDENNHVTGRRFVGLISTMYQIGVVGLLLYLGVWWYGVFRLGNWSSLCLYIPLFLTISFSQPTYMSAFVWFLLFINTRQLSLNPSVSQISLI